MGKSAAVVAHFDVNDHLEDNFRTVLSCLGARFDHVILVSTSSLDDSELISIGNNILLIKRPNFGYDFYSYKVGLHHARELGCNQQILLVNSSFVVCDDEAFSETLSKLLNAGNEQDVVALTESLQFQWHLQSYLILLSSRTLQLGEFREFWDRVQPLNSKLEIILSYEIGLSRLITEHQLHATALFKPKFSERINAYSKWFRIITRNMGWLSWITAKPIHHLKEVNWTHFGAKYIAKEFGVIKTEVLRNNPHELDTNEILSNCTLTLHESIKKLLNNAQLHYSVESSGLSVLKAAAPSIPSIRFLRYGNSSSNGVRIAVVLHLFYADLLSEIVGYLRNIVEPFDIFVTTPFEADIPCILRQLSPLAHSVTVCHSENRGRDIGPFVALLRSRQLDQYTAVLKLHSKKSKYSENGSLWRNTLYQDLMRDSLTIQRIIKIFETNKIGLLGPHPFYLSHDDFWGANRNTVCRLLEKTYANESSRDISLGFFAGSMFWFTPAALSPLQELDESELSFEPESGMQDGTLAHALERAFCPIARSQGYITTSLELNGQEIESTDTHANKVPVL
ncbi:Rhamnan synthesis protein F [compost metagenome]